MSERLYNENLRRQLQERWPATDDYLTRVGQANNDLMVMDEILRAELTIPSWQDRLAIEDQDLRKRPRAHLVLRILLTKGVFVKSAKSIADYQEWLDAYEEDHSGPESLTEVMLRDPYFTGFKEATSDQLWALPEFQDKVKTWAESITEAFGRPQQVSLAQAGMIVNLYQYLDQESTLTHELAEGSMRSLFSSEFFKKAAPRPQKNE